LIFKIPVEGKILSFFDVSGLKEQYLLIVKNVTFLYKIQSLYRSRQRLL
jgi:hypothetical protein